MKRPHVVSCWQDSWTFIRGSFLMLSHKVVAAEIVQMEIICLLSSETPSHLFIQT